MIKISTITAPSSPSSSFYVGKGLSGSDGSITIFGYPLPNYLGTIVPNTIGAAPWNITDATTLFDISSLTEDHEVVVVLYSCPSYVYSGVTFTWKWYRIRDNQDLAEGINLTYYISDPPEGQVYAPGVGSAVWMGWVSEFISIDRNVIEIMENGYYYATLTATGGLNFSQDVYFAVSGMPAFTRLSNPTTTGFDWKVGLTNTFDTNSYIRVGVCNHSFTNGQSSAPSGIVSYVNAPSPTSNSCVVEGTITGQSQGTTYTLYGFAQAANGLYYTCGSDSITTLGSARPALFYWDNSKVSGNSFDIKASEWNRMIQNIKDVHTYKLGSYNASNYPMSNVSSEGIFYADRFNECRYAIGSLNATGIYTKYPGDIVYASDINTLSTKLNEIT